MKPYWKMQNVRRHKNNKVKSGKDLSVDVKRAEEFFTCLNCGQRGEMIQVHGNYQFSNCKTVIVIRCNGD